MKKILISMLAVAALVSCSKEESIRVDQGELIGFGNAFVDNSTRATDPSYSGPNKLTSFQVWGTVKANETATPVAIFEDDTVTGTVGVDSEWTCNVKQYWINDALYNFAALANADAVALGDDKLPKTVTYTADQTDLVYAKSIQYTGKASGNDLVAFTFQHLLSKVNIKVINKSSAATNYSFLVKNLKINAPKTAGSYDIAKEEWTATAGYYVFANISVAGGAAEAECDAEQLLIPGAATISFDVDIMVDDTVVSTAPYTFSTTLAAANAYNFNINVSVGDPIQFTVEKNPEWTDNDPVGIN